MEYQYDLANNLTKKTYEDGSYQTYTYSKGYQLTQTSTSTGYTWAFDYDANGNMIRRRLNPGGLNVTNWEATYDEYNRLIEYRFQNSGAYYKIEYDAVGRVWKRTDTHANETLSYHTGGKLIQEIQDDEGEKTLLVDYLADLRRLMPEEEQDANKYRYYTRDHKGTVSMMTDDDENIEEYNYDAWGEHYDPSIVPSTPNDIRYAGKRVETFVDQIESDTDVIYENGMRHYWPSYGRFLQRDPNCYFKLPSPSRPKTANPYIFADNDPVMKDDPSGFETMVRGARMGDKYFTLGTKQSVPWDQLFNCCGSEGFYTGLDDLNYDVLSVANNNKKKAGTHPYSWYRTEDPWYAGDLCSNDALAAQPNESCGNITSVDSSLACFYLKSCEGASCNFTPFDDECIPDICYPGLCEVDYGYDSTIGASCLLLATSGVNKALIGKGEFLIGSGGRIKCKNN